MKNYGIYIKSHCEATDYENFVDANNKEEAAVKFSRIIPEWGAEDLMPFIEEMIDGEQVMKVLHVNFIESEGSPMLIR